MLKIVGILKLWNVNAFWGIYDYFEPGSSRLQENWDKRQNILNMTRYKKRFLERLTQGGVHHSDRPTGKIFQQKELFKRFSVNCINNHGNIQRDLCKDWTRLKPNAEWLIRGHEAALMEISAGTQEHFRQWSLSLHPQIQVKNSLPCKEKTHKNKSQTALGQSSFIMMKVENCRLMWQVKILIPFYRCSILHVTEAQDHPAGLL